LICLEAAAIFTTMNRGTFILSSLATALLLTSCSRQDNPREFADRFVAAESKAWATGNVDDLKALEDAGVVYHLPGLELTGWKAHEDFIVNGRANVSNLKQNWKYLSGEANHIVLAYDSSAVLKATDKSPAQAASNNFLFVLRLKDQKVVEVWANGSQANAPSNP
jgi:ketosteroid isomerase-like protein